MPQVFDLGAALTGMSQATKGFEESMSADSSRDYTDALTQRVKLETTLKENEALREDARMAGLQKAAAWASKWMGRDRVDTSKGLNPDALQRIAGVARRGPLAFGAAYGSEWSRELNAVLEQKRSEAQQIASQMDPRDARAFLADQEAEAAQEVEFAAKDAVKRGLSRLVSNASRVGFDEGMLDTAEQMATLLDEGAIDVGTAERFLFEAMDALATERANVRAIERTVQRIDQMAAEAQDPKWYEDLAADVESGFLTPDEGYRMAREKQSGLDGTITVSLPGLKQPVQSRTELFRGAGRSSSTMPKSARAEAFLLGGQIASGEPGYENLSLEERSQAAADKTMLLLQMGGWELDEEDRATLESAAAGGGPGASWQTLTPQRQAFARDQLLKAAEAGADEEGLLELLDNLGVDPEDVPPEVQAQVADVYAGKVRNRNERERADKNPMAPPGLTPGQPPAPLEVPRFNPMMADPAMPTLPNWKAGQTVDRAKVEELLKALKGGR